ncbi:MAG: ParB/RepB/Spo0J family partition protein [Ignavibacteria bacterium]|nr:ParB/RepB/Spo0J family partition protein [Ignavibacteria bacterium]
MADKKNVLGKGLSAIFGDKTSDLLSDKEEKQLEQRGKEQIIYIELDKLIYNKAQPRKDFSEDKLAELIESIKLNGILQPILVKPIYEERETRYYLIAGERRVRAALKLGMEKIPAYIKEDIEEKSEQLLELALTENLQRENLNPMELSDAYQRLINEFGLTQEEIAKKVSKDRSTIANFLRLQKLPLEIQESLRKGEITEAHARLILRIEDLERQIEYWKKTITESLTVQELYEQTKEFVKQPKKKKRQKRSSSAELEILEKSSKLQNLEEQLMHFFGTRVRIKPKSQSSGEIVIEYYNDDDIDRIIDRCTPEEK